MISTPPAPPGQLRLAKQVREQFVAHACSALTTIAGVVGERMATLSTSGGNAREMQQRRDGLLAYQALSQGNSWNLAKGFGTAQYRRRGRAV